MSHTSRLFPSAGSLHEVGMNKRSVSIWATIQCVGKEPHSRQDPEIQSHFTPCHPHMISREQHRATRRGRAAILIAFRVSKVRNCDRVFPLKHGRLAASGNYDGLVATSDRFRAPTEAV